MNELYVLIGVDCDHDRKRFNKSIKDREISWAGYKYFYQYFNIVRQRISNEFNLTPVLTLNIRADKQVKEALGRFNACFDIFEKFLDRDFYQQDELAWHNHHWRFKNNCWIQESDDTVWLEENISQSFEAIKQYNIISLHTGWCFQNTLTMNLYNDLGIKIDYSAMPKMFKLIGNCDKYDYRFVENNQIYIPSRQNYQKKDYLKQNKILEIPVTTAQSQFLNFLTIIKNFQKTKRQNSHIGITTHPFLYSIFLNNVFSQNNLKYFITFFHSDELLPDNFKNKEISFFYKQDSIYYNLKKLILIAKKHKKNIKFINFKDFYSIYESGYFD